MIFLRFIKSLIQQSKTSTGRCPKLTKDIEYKNKSISNYTVSQHILLATVDFLRGRKNDTNSKIAKFQNYKLHSRK